MNIITALTLAVPPEFPIVMSMGILFSLRRLRIREIFCIDSSKINVAGRISIMVFDKTGTLTDDGLVCNSSKIKDGKYFAKKIKAKNTIVVPPNVYTDERTYRQNKDNSYLKYTECMAACHQVTILNEECFGDPLDVEMFKVAKWSMLDNSEDKVTAEDIVETWVYPPEIMEKIKADKSYRDT
jgi:cation-transporting ATPase 13A2